LFSFSTAMSADRDDRQRQFEAGARAAFELRAGRELSDAEWVALRGRLLEFVGILRAWDHGTNSTNSPQRGKVESLCQPEP
jgi:hypothetical protein